MSKIPDFKSPEEEQEFWSRHSALEFMGQGEEVEIDASEARKKREKRQTEQISLRVSRRVLQRARRRAEALGVPYQTLLQLWIAERLEQEEAHSRQLTGRG